MLSAMARCAIQYLKRRGLTDVAIAAQVGCERRTVARVLRHADRHELTKIDPTLPAKPSHGHRSGRSRYSLAIVWPPAGSARTFPW